MAFSALDTKRGLQGIRVSDLRAGYADSEVLRDVSLTLPVGQISVLVGPGGSGKTTFLKALLGCPSSQALWCRGEIDLPSDPRAQSQRPERQRGTLAEVLAPMASECERQRSARRLLDEVWGPGSLAGEWLELYLGRTDGAVPDSCYRLAAFTATVARAANCYVFDEPDADLPSGLLGPLADRIRILSPAATVLLVTHNLLLARQVADYAVLMVDGEVIEADCGRRFFDLPQHPRTQDFVRLGC